MIDRMQRYTQHLGSTGCGWWHNRAEPCPRPIDMLREARQDYDDERAAALEAGVSEDAFSAGWERRHVAELERARRAIGR